MRSALAVALIVAVIAGWALPGAAADYPARDSRYHSYPEMAGHIKAVAARQPGIVRIFSIGRSYQGRELWAAEVSDNVGVDEGEPEILFDGLHHAREHLSAEMPIYILDLLTSNYGRKTPLGRRVTNLVDKRRTWIVFMVNPDGLQYDLTGSPYRSWRKSRQPIPGSRRLGIDLNRNYGYGFGCCGGSSGKPSAFDYRGPRAWAAPEVRAMRDFVNSRVVGGRQRIRTHITFHSAGELVLWPMAHTRTDLPADMTAIDRAAFRAMGKAMARTNGYRAMQSSSLYKSDGDMIDWMYARHRIFSFTFELYPKGDGSPERHYPPDEVIARESRRNREAVLYLMARAVCPYGALGAKAARNYCGPLYDDFERGRGWQVDARGTDTARDGHWQRGDPLRDDFQLGSAISGKAVLVTGRQPGRDVDGGSTTIRSPYFTVPAHGRSRVKLRYWVGLSVKAGASDGLAIRLVDGAGRRVKVLHKVSGNGRRQRTIWRAIDKPIPSSLAGQRLALEIEAVDAGADSMVEAGIDQVRVTSG